MSVFTFVSYECCYCRRRMFYSPLCCSCTRDGFSRSVAATQSKEVQGNASAPSCFCYLAWIGKSFVGHHLHERNEMVAWKLLDVFWALDFILSHVWKETYFYASSRKILMSLRTSCTMKLRGEQKILEERCGSWLPFYLYIKGRLAKQSIKIKSRPIQSTNHSRIS